MAQVQTTTYEHKTLLYERFFYIAVNALGAPGVPAIRSREASVTQRFSKSMGEQSGPGIMSAWSATGRVH